MSDIVRKNLRQFREEVGLTTEKAAQLSGVSIDSLRRYEGGKSGAPGDVVHKLAAIYGRPMDDFYNPNPPEHVPGSTPAFHASSMIPENEMDKFTIEQFRKIQDFIRNANEVTRNHLAKRKGK